MPPWPHLGGTVVPPLGRARHNVPPGGLPHLPEARQALGSSRIGTGTTAERGLRPNQMSYHSSCPLTWTCIDLDSYRTDSRPEERHGH